MKISCPSCSAKYSVADEKIQARLAKIRCRKCSSTIVIDGTANPPTVSVADAAPAVADATPGGVAAAVAQPPAESLAPVESQPAPAGLAAAGDSQPFAESPQQQMPGESQESAAMGDASAQAVAEPGPNGPTQGEFAVDIADNDQRNMSVAEIVAAYNEGVITAETYIWREGMADWETLAEVPEIATALHAAAATSAPADPALSPIAGPGAGGGSSNENSSTDLFGGIDRAGGEDDITTSAPDTEYQATAGTGARNESSVLFSLSALTASEAGPKGPEAGMSAAASSDDSGLIDLQALTAAEAAPMSAGGMAAGGAPGFGASPLMSAPLGGVSGPVLGGPMGTGYNKTSSSRGWILGGVGTLAILLAAFAFFFKEGAGPSVTAEPAKSAPAQQKNGAATGPGGIDETANNAAAEEKTPTAEGARTTDETAKAEAVPEEAEPDALSAKDLAVVKAPPVKKARRVAPRRKVRRAKPTAKKAVPARAKTPAPVTTTKPKKKKKKKRKKKKKKRACNCAPSDLMCAMQCSARKR